MNSFRDIQYKIGHSLTHLTKLQNSDDYIQCSKTRFFYVRGLGALND